MKCYGYICIVYLIVSSSAIFKRSNQFRTFRLCSELSAYLRALFTWLFGCDCHVECQTIVQKRSSANKRLTCSVYCLAFVRARRVGFVKDASRKRSSGKTTRNMDNPFCNNNLLSSLRQDRKRDCDEQMRKQRKVSVRMRFTFS